MKISINSWHVKLYKYIWKVSYMYNGDLPNNLCSYFWITLINIILFIPIFILRTPLYLIWIFTMIFKFKKIEYKRFLINMDMDYNKENSTSLNIIFLVFVILAMILFEYHFIRGIMNLPYNKEFYFGAQLINTVFLIMGAAILLVVKSSKKKHKKPSLLKEFIKAKYHKYCPKIEWINEEE